ncbi:MAG: hypothetical protein ABI919_08135, partial [Ramlibacter sp.]
MFYDAARIAVRQNSEPPVRPELNILPIRPPLNLTESKKNADRYVKCAVPPSMAPALPVLPE